MNFVFLENNMCSKKTCIFCRLKHQIIHFCKSVFLLPFPPAKAVLISAFTPGNRLVDSAQKKRRAAENIWILAIAFFLFFMQNGT